MKTLPTYWRWYLVGMLTLGNFFTWYVVMRETRNGWLTLAFLDVGQGDAIYVEAPNGNQLLIDGGPDKRVLRSLGAMVPFYDRSLDLLVLSHPHKDHVAGLVAVLRRYEVAAALSSGAEHHTPEYALWRQLLEQQAIEEILARRGVKINMGAGVILEILLPNRDVTKAEPHDGMLVLQLRYGETAVMLTGDMEKPLENYLVAFEAQKLKSDLLKVGHHGSRTSTSPTFLGYVGPTYAVISSAKDDPYGHPHQETLELLERFKVKTLLTEEKGTIVIKSDGLKMSVL